MKLGTMHSENVGNDKSVAPGPGGAGKPEFYLPFEPGRELFTAVLPDNRTVSMAAQEKNIRKYLFPKDAPHVTLLSLQDIGTF